MVHAAGNWLVALVEDPLPSQSHSRIIQDWWRRSSRRSRRSHFIFQRDTIPKPSAPVGAERPGASERRSHEVEQNSSLFDLHPIFVRTTW